MSDNHIRWRRSSYSGNGASNCVECAELDPTWHKSSYSGNGASECVECADLGHTHAVRDSKNPDGPMLTIRSTAWRGLLAAVKAAS